MNDSRIQLSAILAAIFVATAVFAYPTDCVVAPNARVLPPNTAEVQFQYHGVQVFEGREYDGRLGLQVGLDDGWELGYDRRFGPPDTRGMDDGYFFWDIQYNPEKVGWERDWFNIKKQLWHETTHRPAVAVGIVNIGATVKDGRYVSVGKRFGDFTIMLGWSDVLDDEYVHEGISYQINDKWDFHAEHVGRGRWSTNAAFEGRVGPKTYLSVGYMRANNSIYPDSLFANISYRFNLRDF